jgi:sortase A
MKSIAVFVGIIAILAAVGLITYNRSESEWAGRNAEKILQALVEEIDVMSISDDSEPDYTPPPLIEIGGELYIGILKIPALSLELPINNVLDYDRLKNSPCRYVGDLSGNLVISAHNYRQHFRSISTLTNGDTVVIVDGNGTEHNFTVELIEIIHGTDIYGMINSPYDLTLFTCTSTRTERYTVRCVREGKIIEHTGGKPEHPTFEIDPNAPDTPTYTINYRTETLRIGRGHIYSTDYGVTFVTVTESITLYVSEYITLGTPIFIRRAATTRRSESHMQTITPADRAILENTVLIHHNGRLTLDSQYEVYNPATDRWGRLPRITANAEFDIRLKNTAITEDGVVTGNAASIPGKLKITWGEFSATANRSRSGIIAAEIIP